MLFQMPKHFIVQQIIQAALMAGQPVVALESTVISHGLPYPENLHLAKEMEKIIIEEKARPATIAIIEGQVRVGLDSEELEILAQGESLRKVSVRDFAPAIVQKPAVEPPLPELCLSQNESGSKSLLQAGSEACIEKHLLIFPQIWNNWQKAR